MRTSKYKNILQKATTEIGQGGLFDQESKRFYTMDIRYQWSQRWINCWNILSKGAAKDKPKTFRFEKKNQEKKNERLYVK